MTKAIHRSLNILLLISGVAGLTALRAGSPDYVNGQLPWHKPVLDNNGKLLAWFEPGQNLGYDKVLRLGWDFIEHKVPKDTRHGTGLKIYLIRSEAHTSELQSRQYL